MANTFSRKWHTQTCSFRGENKNGKESIIKPAGIALTADVALRRAVNVVCSIRKGKKSVGGVTSIVREANVKDKRAAKTQRKKRKEAAEAAEITKMKNRASKVDEAMETIKSGDLMMDCGLLDKYLESISSNKKSSTTRAVVEKRNAHILVLESNFEAKK